MNVVGIICEYNPFHLGHLYQLKTARSLCEAEAAVAVMSGNFTQRGECAVIDKYHRTKMALAAGFDLVLELPSIYAAAASGYFAQGAVLSLAASGVVNYLSFGSENADEVGLSSCAEILSSEPEEYRELLRSLLAQGLSYPKAQGAALEKLYQIDLLAQNNPNDLLGLNYLTVITRHDLPLAPIIVPRLGKHNGENISGFASSQNIRAMLAQNLPIDDDVPNFSRQILNEAHLLFNSQLASAQLSLLRRASVGELADLPDINEDLAHRLKKACGEYRTLAEVLTAVKNKSCTYSRLSRAVCHLLLGITKDDYAPEPLYLRVLGFGEKGEALLKMLKKHSSLPLITNLSAAKRLLTPEAQKMLEIDLRSAAIYRAFSGEFSSHDEYRLFPVKQQ